MSHEENGVQGREDVTEVKNKEDQIQFEWEMFYDDNGYSVEENIG